MIDSVQTISPPGYFHAQTFAEIAEAFFEALGSPSGYTGSGLIFGAHTLETDTLRKDDIIYQSEQITPECPWVQPTYIELLKAHEVWDYSEKNVKELAKRGIDAKLVPIRYMPSMTKNFPVVEQDVDVLFYGSMNPWRTSVLKALQAKKLKVRHLFGVYGEERDEVIAASKVVLNLHYYEHGIFEIFRCAHLFANSKCVVTERGGDAALDLRYRDAAVFVKSTTIVETVAAYVKDNARRKEQEHRAFEAFSRPTLMEELAKLK